jgi:hypothetical protein
MNISGFVVHPSSTLSGWRDVVFWKGPFLNREIMNKNTKTVENMFGRVENS